jgi:hypothetical protein
MDNLLILQVILPLVINLISGILLAFFANLKQYRMTILIITFIILGNCLYFAYIQTPELVVVPNLRHQWVDQATVLCKKIGLKAEIKSGDYGARQNEVQKQSLAPGSLVFMNSTIEISVCRGNPVGDPLYNFTPGQIAQVTNEGVNK